MQNYYNSISSTKRVAFVDQLTDTQAKTLSNQYPFAICFANNCDEDSNPVIWYNGQRYGIVKVNKDLIVVGETSIGLNLDNNGELRLILSDLIDTTKLNTIHYLYDGDNFSGNIRNEYLVNDGNDIPELYTLKNQFILSFNYYKKYEGNPYNDSNINQDNIDLDISNPETNVYYIKTTDFNKELNLGSNDLYKIEYNSSYNKYVLTVLNSGQINLQPTFIINNEIKQGFPQQLSLVYCPDSCNWKTLNRQSLSTLQFDVDNPPTITFDYDKGQVTNGIKAYLCYKENGLDRQIGESEISPNDNISNIIIENSRLLEDYNSFDIFIKLVYTEPYTNKVYDKNLNRLKINIGSSNKLFFIGENNNENINDENSYKNPQPIENLLNNWHSLDLSDNNFNNSNLQINENTVVYLPEGYSLGLPIYQDEEMNQPIQDPVFTKTEEYISKYNIKYYKWVISEEYKERNDLYFLSIIYKENNI